MRLEIALPMRPAQVVDLLRVLASDAVAVPEAATASSTWNYVCQWPNADRLGAWRTFKPNDVRPGFLGVC
jgi:hypothetical protein